MNMYAPVKNPMFKLSRRFNSPHEVTERVAQLGRVQADFTWIFDGFWYMGVSIVMGNPQNAWFMMENPNLKWMMTRGTPIYGTPPYFQVLDLTWRFRDISWVL